MAAATTSGTGEEDGLAVNFIEGSCKLRATHGPTPGNCTVGCLGEVLMDSGTERELAIAIWKNSWARVFMAAGLEVNEALNGNLEVVVLYFDVRGSS